MKRLFLLFSVLAILVLFSPPGKVPNGFTSEPTEPVSQVI